MNRRNQTSRSWYRHLVETFLSLITNILSLISWLITLLNHNWRRISTNSLRHPKYSVGFPRQVPFLHLLHRTRQMGFWYFPKQLRYQLRRSLQLQRWGFFLLGLVLSGLMTVMQGLTIPVYAGTLQINQSASTTTVDSGIFFTYTINYSCSISSCEDVQISTILDSDLDNNSANVSLSGGNNSSYNQGTSNATWNLGNLSAGESSQVSLTLRFPPGITPNGAQSETTTTSITSTNSPDITGQTAPTVTAIATNKMIVSKSISAGGALGQDTVYRIDVCNPDADGDIGSINFNNINISDTLPAGVTFVSASDGGTLSGSTVTWSAISSFEVDNKSSCLSRFLTVRYDPPTYNLGDTPTNNATVQATLPDGSVINETPSETLTLVTPQPSLSFNKARQFPIRKVGDTQQFRFRIENTGTQALDNFVLTDTIPSEIEVTTIRIGDVEGGVSTSVTVQYQTNLNSTFTTVLGSPFTMSTSGNGTTVDVASLGLAAGEYITQLRYNYGTLPIGFKDRNSPYTGFEAQVLTTDRNSNSVNAGDIISNTADINYTGGSTSDSVDFDIVEEIPSGFTNKVLLEPLSGIVFPGDIVKYRLDLRNTNDATGTLVEPVVADFLDENLEYVDTTSITTAISGVSVPTPTIEVLDNYNSTGRQLIRWNWDGTGFQQPIGSRVRIEFQARVKAGSPIGTYQNYTHLVDYDNTLFNSIDCNGNGTNKGGRLYVTDVNDLDGDSNITEQICQSNPVEIEIKELAKLDAVKLSQGDLDSNFVEPPNLAQATADGTIQYKASITNLGNVALTNLVVVDILPSAGDSYVAISGSRGSQWLPTLAGTLTAPGAATIYYSIASNPCRPEVDHSPPGCLAPGWSTTPPSPISDVTAIKLDFGSTVIQPSDTFEFIWPMNIPATVNPGEVAINSFGYKVVRNDNSQPLSTAEVIATAVEIQQPVANKPNVLLVKRITAVNGSTNINGNDLSTYINQQDDLNTDGNPYDDNDITVPTPINPGDPQVDTDKWLDPTTFLIGGIDVGLVAPGDEIEYTVYFISTGDNIANNVLLCDRLPNDVTFIPNAFNSTPAPDLSGLPGSDRGIVLSLGSSDVSLTNAEDGDSGQFFPAGVDPTTKYPHINCGGSNTNGAVVVEVGNLPHAISPGVPHDSYGFIRFRSRVN
ncbi:MAG: hypothetical protein F6K36_24005 [Symploca sp. SIO3C6]|nr:hypothetical protein [Symploca sp. SIO3C6]